MAAHSANIKSPEVIRRFRNHFVEFDSECHRGIEGVRSDIRSVLEWLRREQSGYWKQQLRKRTELFEEAKREYNRVRYNTGYGRKPSALDEKRAMERARRRKEEAEQKIVAVKRWILAVDHDAGRAFRPCARLSSMLETITPKALSRLDRMLDELDEYLRLHGDGKPK